MNAHIKTQTSSRHFIHQAHTLNRGIRTFAINTTGQSNTAKLLSNLQIKHQISNN